MKSHEFNAMKHKLEFDSLTVLCRINQCLLFVRDSLISDASENEKKTQQKHEICC